MFLVTNPEHSLMQAAMETTNFISATACTKIENLDLGTSTYNKWGPQQPRPALRITEGFGLKGTLKIPNPSTMGSTPPLVQRITELFRLEQNLESLSPTVNLTLPSPQSKKASAWWTWHALGFFLPVVRSDGTQWNRHDTVLFLSLYPPGGLSHGHSASDTTWVSTVMFPFFSLQRLNSSSYQAAVSRMEKITSFFINHQKHKVRLLKAPEHFQSWDSHNFPVPPSQDPHNK